MSKWWNWGLNSRAHSNYYTWMNMWISAETWEKCWFSSLSHGVRRGRSEWEPGIRVCNKYPIITAQWLLDRTLRSLAWCHIPWSSNIYGLIPRALGCRRKWDGELCACEERDFHSGFMSRVGGTLPGNISLGFYNGQTMGRTLPCSITHRQCLWKTWLLVLIPTLICYVPWGLKQALFETISSSQEEVVWDS